MSELEATTIAIRFIMEREAFVAHAYPDPLRGWRVPTVGYGTTVYPDGTRVKRHDVIGKTQARECLMHYIEHECLPSLRQIPTWPHMNPNQQAALISFTYNLGPWFKKPNRESITRLAQHPELWTDAAEVVTTFLKYRNPGTAVEDGLRLRRLLEANLFLTKPK